MVFNPFGVTALWIVLEILILVQGRNRTCSKNHSVPTVSIFVLHIKLGDFIGDLFGKLGYILGCLSKFDLGLGQQAVTTARIKPLRKRS